MKNTSGKIPQKSNFFWNFVLRKLWRVRKNVIISHKVDSQNILIFSPSEAKKRQKFDPLRDGWDAMIRISIRGKEICLRESSPKKFVFWGFFETEIAQTWISQAIRNLEIIFLFIIKIRIKNIFDIFLPSFFPNVFGIGVPYFNVLYLRRDSNQVLEHPFVPFRGEIQLWINPVAGKTVVANHKNRIFF